ncbi:MAG: bifunctional adenosylcobinamide kinase/adenosylcobinamide-phosphate guanylyltransferase [Candidatus Binatia bacterium]
MSQRQVVLITGGARSGKSRYAEERAREAGARRLYVATAEAKDEEMALRIVEHRERRGREWITVEEPIELKNQLLRCRGQIDCALVDCLTLWLSNLLLSQDEKAVIKKIDELVDALTLIDFHVFFVSNEVGSAVVPDNALARKFRDLVGLANQRVAEAADEVVLMVAGLPMIVKQGAACS